MIEWTEEDEKITRAAIKKATQNYISMPRGYEREDMLQEGRLAWLKAKEKYDHNRKKTTFAFKAISNHVKNLIIAGNTDKRKIAQYLLSYDEVITEEIFWKGIAKGDPRGNIDKDYSGK
jgi:DNA-directed RNA polymerase specialized sigma subunit